MYIYTAFSDGYGQQKISDVELPGFFADCCVRGLGGARPMRAQGAPSQSGPGGPHKGPAHKGPRRAHTSPMGAHKAPAGKGPAHEGPGGPQGPSP